MAEQLTVTIPPVAAVSKDYRVTRLELDWDQPRIGIKLLGPDGEIGHAYQGPTALALLVALNKANLSTQSLHRRILTRLVADEVIVGTISGAPD